jgi:hypothetical protein
MPTFRLKALIDAHVSDDRSGITLNLDTDQGPVSLAMTATELDHFSTAWEGVEQGLTMLDPVSGTVPGEAAQMRRYIVDDINVGGAVVNNVPSVIAVIKAGNSTRAYAFDRQKAETLCQRVGDEVPSLERLKTDDRH